MIPDHQIRIPFKGPTAPPNRPVRGNTQDSCLVIYHPAVSAEGWADGPRWSWIPVPR